MGIGGVALATVDYQRALVLQKCWQLMPTLGLWWPSYPNNSWLSRVAVNAFRKQVRQNPANGHKLQQI